MKRGTNPKSLANLMPPWPPGVDQNPGGKARGKRISTWMVELGQMDNLPEADVLPVNGRIALNLIKKALSKFCEHATDILLDRTEGKQSQPITFEPGITKEQFIEWARNHPKSK